MCPYLLQVQTTTFQFLGWYAWCALHCRFYSFCCTVSVRFHEKHDDFRYFSQIAGTSKLRPRIQACLFFCPLFVLSASLAMSRLTSSFTCQLISFIITTVIIHHSITPGSKHTFSTNPSHLNTSSTLHCFLDHGT